MASHSHHCCHHHDHDHHDCSSVAVKVGQVIEQHPFQFGDGAMIELCRNDLDNEIFIGLAGLTRQEIEMLSTETVQLGLLPSESGAGLIVVKVGEISLDVQFNAAAIPADQYRADIASTMRLLVLDTRTKELKVVREVTLPNEFVAALSTLVAVQRDCDAQQIHAENAHLLNTLSPEQLSEQITLINTVDAK